MKDGLGRIAESKQTYESGFSGISQVYHEKFTGLYAKCKIAVDLGLVLPLDETKWQQKNIGPNKLQKLVQLYKKRQDLVTKISQIDDAIKEID